MLRGQTSIIQTYDILLWNKFQFLFTQFAFGIRPSESVWFPSGALVPL